MKCKVTILVCFLRIFAVAQNQKQLISDSLQIDLATSIYIDTGSLLQHNTVFSYPFDSIVFKDVRFDTSSIGSSNKIAFFSDKNKFRLIKFENGLAGFLTRLLNNASVLHRDAANDKLVCYIKRFRITEVDTVYQKDVKKSRQVMIRSAIETYYVHQDKMYPAYRTDTSFLQFLSENRTAYFIIDSLMQAFCEKVSRIDKNKMLKKRSYSEFYVDSVYSQRFNIPVLTTNSYAKGVYLSSKEFFNNRPSMTEYEWRSDKRVNILYTKDENGQWQVTRRHVFGLCDGTHVWFRIGNDFYAAFRRENTFQVIAPIYLKRLITDYAPTVAVPTGGTIMMAPSGVNKDVPYNDESLYEIDMETGEFY